MNKLIPKHLNKSPILFLKGNSGKKYLNSLNSLQTVLSDNIPSRNYQEKQSHINTISSKNSKIQNRKSSFSRLNPIKKGLEIAAKRVLNPLGKTTKEILHDLWSGDNPSFYAQDTRDGSNELDTYLFGEDYHTPFTGNSAIGPQFQSYINRNYPGQNIKTYNTHFGDTLYIDNSGRERVDYYLKSGKTAGGSMGRFSDAASQIVTKQDDRPYDAGGMLMKFRTVNSSDSPSGIVADMADIYDFLPKDFNDKYHQTSLDLAKKKMIQLMHSAGTPFIVRQNDIPVVFKDMYPEMKTNALKKMAEFLGQFGDYYNINDVKKLSDKQIEAAFKSEKTSGDDIINYLILNKLIRRKK